MNHFNEWLAQFQAKETTDIPDEVYGHIFLEGMSLSFAPPVGLAVNCTQPYSPPHGLLIRRGGHHLYARLLI